MNSAEVLNIIKDAGIIGAGGAGFPAHIKLNCSAETVIANGAECEPLLRTDRLFMEKYPEKVIFGLKAAMFACGAKRGVIALKKKYTAAITALKSAAGANIEFLLMDSFYPAGDEQMIVHMATGKVVPTGGLPLDVGAVVQNVFTLGGIADAVNEGKPAYERFVTVNGEVKHPAVYIAPVGISVREMIAAAGGPEDLSGYGVIIGGPMMGRVTKNIDEPVTKTTGGILVLPASHPLFRMKTGSEATDLKLAKSVCCQCNFCTQLCPRNALGLNVEPHKAMRIAAFGASGLEKMNGIFSCCDCGLCTMYACNFGLAPSRIMQRAKAELIENGIKPVKKTERNVSGNIEDTKVPVSRLIARLGIGAYDKDLKLVETPVGTNKVRLPLRMHIGAPSQPVVNSGEYVEKGQLVAAVKERVGANIHASIAGRVQVMESYIEIEGARS
jgi:Na+-translocating ferredoxin:NAD+ oxidoreductase RnfC subunit